MHRLLHRQLKKVYGKGFDVDLLSDKEQLIIELVSNTYSSHYKEQAFLERTLEFNSKELNTRNQEIKKALQELKDSHLIVKHEREQLAVRVNERTRELASALERAKDANRTKSEFLANMSHEIRTPLNAILGFIDLLKDSEQNDENRQYLETINSSSQSLLSIVDDILDFSKMESGKLTIDASTFNPDKEFNLLADLFKARASEKNLSLLVDISSELPAGLKADILRLKQIISNLLPNAV